MRVERNIMWYVAFFLMTAGGVYGLVEGDEDAGPILLFVAGCLGALVAVFLTLQDRQIARDESHAIADPWFPHASVWPFTIGLAAFFIFNGLILGIWFLVPGFALLVLAILGFAGQTRRRD